MNSFHMPQRRHRLAGVLVVIPLLAAACTAAAPSAVPAVTSPETSAATTSATTPPTAPAVPVSTTGAPVAASTTQATAVLQSGAITADHTSTDPAAVPGDWLLAAQETVVWAYGSTSHGTQIWAGAQYLADHDPQLGFAADWRVLPEANGLLMAYDDGWSWDPETFADGVRALLDEVPRATAFMWSWCGELSDPGTDLDAYLDAMTVLQAEYPGVTFVAMTGHTDGGSPALDTANQRIREWAQATGSALFDFADIERFDPGGGDHPDADDACPWCSSWCASHPEDCAGLDDVDCAHSHPLTCRLKAGAFWWLSARLAGWDGGAGTTP